jgi:hypothetical protein
MRDAEIRPIRIPLRYPQEKGLVLYLPFDRIGEKKAFDLSPYKNHGTIYGAVWKPGKIGQALSFDGVDDYVDCGNAASLNITDALTIEVWIKSNVTSLYDRGIVCKGQSGTWARNAYELRTSNTYTSTFSISNGTTPVQINVYYNPNEWVHIVGVTSKALGKIQIYKNGKLYNEINRTIGDIQVISSPLHIGHGARTWDGLIDEVRIYNRALSAAEIKEHYYRMNRVLAQITR